MSRFERLLIPIIALVIAGAFLLERLDPSGVRIIAIALGLLLIVAMVYGMYRRTKRKLREGRAQGGPDHTSNDPRGS